MSPAGCFFQHINLKERASILINEELLFSFARPPKHMGPWDLEEIMHHLLCNIDVQQTQQEREAAAAATRWMRFYLLYN